jgi:hypothetical protein
VASDSFRSYSILEPASLYRLGSSAVSNNPKILRRLIVTRKFMELLAELKRPKEIYFLQPPPPLTPAHAIISGY